MELSWLRCLHEIGSSGTKKSGRGPTRCIELSKRAPGERFDVSFNIYNQPIGVFGRKLTSYLGLIVRDGQIAPLTYTDWRGMPNDKKERMWKLALVLQIVFSFLY